MPFRTSWCSLSLCAAFALCACGDDDAAAEGGGVRPNASDAGGSDGGPRVRRSDSGLDAGAPAAAAVCDVVPPTVCREPKPTFADVQPILQDRCLSCHDGTSEEWPLVTYSHVASWYAQVRDAMIHCTQPPPAAGIDMPREEREALLHWIVCGIAP